MADEYAYQIVVIEDLEDDRFHTFDENESPPGQLGQVELAGIREAIPIHEIAKIFYADTGKILNIGNESEANAPVLLLKRDLNAVPPRRTTDRYDDDDSSAEQKNGRDETQESSDTPVRIQDRQEEAVSSLRLQLAQTDSALEYP